MNDTGPMPLDLFTHPACLEHRPPGHPERPERIEAALRGVDRWGGDVRRQAAPVADVDHLTRLHPESHVEAVRRACQTGTWIDADTWAGPGSWDAALRSAGGTLAAAGAAADGTPALAILRPPGHHATADRAMGFCLFNNVGLAADALTNDGRRVAILDIDVHHGNGTQDLFYDRSDVLYVSLHQSPLYPGTGRMEETGQGDGAGHTVNLPLPPGTGHDGWTEVLEAAALPVIRAYRPDVILVSCGYDGHARDPLASLNLLAQTYHAAVTTARRITPRVAVVLEGGYDEQAIERSVAATCAALVDEENPEEEDLVPGPTPWGDIKCSVHEHLGAYWDFGA